MKKIAVIIINHHHADLIKKAVKSFTELSGADNTEIYFINNLPEAETTTWLNENYPEIHIIENIHPQGFARNINQVIRQNPHFEYYLLLNPDVICLPGMLKELIDVMDQDQQIGAAGPQLLNLDGSIQPSRRRFAPFFALVFRALHIDKLFKNLSIIDKYLMKDAQFGPVTEVDWVTGAVMILRKNALDQAGLMDERFYLYFEDEDLCCRLWQHQWKVCYITEAQAYHVHLAEGRNKIFSKANFHHLLSALKMLLKYHGKITKCYDR